ncbi:glycerophosphodiester phosphodiesterase family protein [Mucilaginibacter boryungensis]|uniref:Glycerophosphodiester phosphodiesterase n=1 Tax=Mucilaginibacter boryungensis TaxID=768480 RepID=A0ABR9XG42_9SPHI|nr:glycerophosphodiester phosphodiesterase family protein [Mucilaginibacter boryungensis]MBE9666165.1 glycerophosphodiester phosphodiesterase [Mucilaginibacter boryungensis]
MKRTICLALLSGFILSGCFAQKSKQVKNMPYPAFDREAHRGGRGLMPENTIPAMINTVNLGMETLEMDLHITADNKVIVSHDEYINPLFSLTPDGKEIPKEDNRKYILYKMNYAEIAKFDVGSKPYSKFPDQKKMKVSIPLLADLIDSVQHYIKTSGKRQVFYNIETKSSEKGDGTVNPDPETFVKLMMDVLEEKKILPWVVIQSFDKRTLQILNKKYPTVRTSWLVDNKKSTAENLADLGFKPFIYSPNFKMVTADVVKDCHAQGIKVLPWTPDTKEEIDAMKALGVDGIITDYPNLLQ